MEWRAEELGVELGEDKAKEHISRMNDILFVKGEEMKLCDKSPMGVFGKYYGHPDGQQKSQEMILRILKEFRQSPNDIEEILLSVSIDPSKHVASLQEPIKKAFISKGWVDKPNYPESRYQADFGLNQDGRWLFVEIELSDIRRAVNAFYMSRVFRTGYMRLGIFITPESTKPEKKFFYSSITRRYDYIAPDYPLWVIGFKYP